MCVMWSTADQYSEFENVHKQIKISKSLVTTHCALSQSTRVRMLKYTCKTAQITDSGISYLLSEQSRFFVLFRRNNSGVSVLFWFYLVSDRKKILWRLVNFTEYGKPGVTAIYFDPFIILCKALPIYTLPLIWYIIYMYIYNSPGLSV